MLPDRPVESFTVSRRRLILSGLAVAAGSALPWWAAPTAALAGPPGQEDRDRAYQAAFRAVLAEDPQVRYYDERGKEYLYRPRQLLVSRRDFQDVQVRLRELGYEFSVGQGFGRVERLYLSPQFDIPSVVARLRDPETWPGRKVPRVQPHHVTVGFDNLMGNPGGPPAAHPGPLPPPDPARIGDGAGVTVGICDTGIWRYAGVEHHDWLFNHYTPEPDDEDPLYTHGQVLALQGGHGTFVAGVLRQSAPGVDFDPETALFPSGHGDEEKLVGALERLRGRVSIVNLSLGCFTSDDLEPEPIANTLPTLGQNVVVVAAAGNAAGTRKMWPAALTGVVGVAAVTRVNGAYVKTSYTNYGSSWVSACAEGEQVSTYVPGKMQLNGVPTVTFPGFARWHGTSFAAPQVAGRLATLMSSNPGMTAVQAKQILLAGTPTVPDCGVLVV